MIGRSTLAAAILLGGLAVGSAANAAPFAPADLVAAPAPTIEKTAYVCGPWGCGWRPGWGGYGYYRPRPVFYGYGPRCWVRPGFWGPRRVCRGW